MFLLRLAKHSVELCFALFVLFVGYVFLTPGEKALNDYMASDGYSSSDHSYHMSRGYRFYPRMSSSHFSAGSIRPSRLR